MARSIKTAVSLRKVCWLLLFSMAMGYLEAAVVVYLRDVYYPGGFQFPLKTFHLKDFYTELGREAATMIMLVGIGLIAGKTKLQKIAFFLISFGIWDIFYYVFLKLILGWPASLLTRDILFLLPVPWVGPVLCPCMLSLTMIALATTILLKEKKDQNFKVSTGNWFWLIGGSIIVIASFSWEPIRHLHEFNSPVMPTGLSEKFDWWLFIIGELWLLAGVFWIGGKRKRFLFIGNS